MVCQRGTPLNADRSRARLSGMEPTRRAAIFLNGGYDPKHAQFYVQACARALVICADGGIRAFDWLMQGAAWAKPHLVVGDCDSMTPADRERWESRGAAFVTAYDERADKEDYTDGQLALHIAVREGCSEFVFYGAFPPPNGSDHDHFLGNLMLLPEARHLAGERQGFCAAIRSPREDIRECVDALMLRRVGDGINRVSLIPFAGEARVRSSDGLRWRLDGMTLPVHRANALRNEMTADAARIELEPDSPPMFVVHNW